MARALTIACDCGCDAVRLSGAERPASWWLLEDQGAAMRTMPMDFATLVCLQRWLARREVRAAFSADFPPVAAKAKRVRAVKK